jgi:four helix bundle protein
METHKQLIAWQKSVDLVVAIYTLTQQFPPDERFGLVSQIQRSVTSIPSNVAEGLGRKSDGDFARFLCIAYGSSSELETQILVSYRLNFINEKEYNEINGMITEIRKMLNKLISRLRAKD